MSGAKEEGVKEVSEGAYARGQRVLIAEDEFLLANDLMRALRAEGAEVLGPHATVERAMNAIAADSLPTAAILDVNLRDSPAYPVADALAEAGIPFIFMTGYSGQSLPERFASVPCCHKPLRAADAVSLLTQRLNNPR